MPVLLVALLVIVPLLELYVLIQAGQLLGIVPTLLLLFAMSLLGGYLLRREGAKTWGAFRAALSQGRVPAAEVADGALVLLGGALLLTPGFVTDLFGLACVLPPSRAVLRRTITRVAARRLGVGGLLGEFDPGRRARPGRDQVIDGEVVDEGPDDRH